MNDREHPGSDAALALGCTCPVRDNNHGKWAPSPPDGWWINTDCRYHWPPYGGPGLDVTANNTDHELGE